MYLISPRIDLTGYTDSALVVKFYSYYRQFSVSLSVDDGASWGTSQIILAIQLANNGTVSGEIAAIFSG